MPNEKHEVHLSEAERKKLLAIISRGRNKAVVIQRAHILLKVAEGKVDSEISQLLYVNENKAKIRWNFTVDEARKVFKVHYPTSLTC